MTARDRKNNAAGLKGDAPIRETGLKYVYHADAGRRVFAGKVNVVDPRAGHYRIAASTEAVGQHLIVQHVDGTDD